jgi:hypothetical protein
MSKEEIDIAFILVSLKNDIIHLGEINLSKKHNDDNKNSEVNQLKKVIEFLEISNKITRARSKNIITQTEWKYLGFSQHKWSENTQWLIRNKFIVREKPTSIAKCHSKFRSCKELLIHLKELFNNKNKN